MTSPSITGRDVVAEPLDERGQAQAGQLVLEDRQVEADVEGDQRHVLPECLDDHARDLVERLGGLHAVLAGVLGADPVHARWAAGSGISTPGSISQVATVSVLAAGADRSARARP